MVAHSFFMFERVVRAFIGKKEESLGDVLDEPGCQYCPDELLSGGKVFRLAVAELVNTGRLTPEQAEDIRRSRKFVPNPRGDLLLLTVCAPCVPLQKKVSRELQDADLLKVILKLKEEARQRALESAKDRREGKKK